MKKVAVTYLMLLVLSASTVFAAETYKKDDKVEVKTTNGAYWPGVVQRIIEWTDSDGKKGTTYVVEVTPPKQVVSITDEEVKDVLRKMKEKK